MAENKLYLAIGEEASRGTKESSTVGFIPLLNAGIPKMGFDEKPRKEFRGEDTVKGDTAVRRVGRKWSASLDMPFFTEAGSTKGMAGTVLKHFFGKTSSSQNGSTGQYNHMMYPVADPFSSLNLGTKAITLNFNINQGANVKNWPFAGGRIKSLSFDQEPGNPLKLSAEFFGQKRDAETSAIANPVFSAENLRCDYSNLKVYTGTITRTGTAPNYAGFGFSSATQIKPDKISLKVENGMEDVMRLSGLDYPDKTRLGKYKVTMEMKLDWEDPSSGFSSVSEFNAWIASSSTAGFLLCWDTGVQAGTGDNHGLFIDLPAMRRVGGEPEYSLDKDPMITFKYEGLLDTQTTGYMIGVLLKNTAATI